MVINERGPIKRRRAPDSIGYLYAFCNQYPGVKGIKSTNYHHPINEDLSIILSMRPTPSQRPMSLGFHSNRAAGHYQHSPEREAASNIDTAFPPLPLHTGNDSNAQQAQARLEHPCRQRDQYQTGPRRFD